MMNAKQICNRSELHWEEIGKNVKDSLVILDDAAAECLHWHGGLKKLVDGGAVSIENFSPFVKADSEAKVVFVLMSPLTGEVWRTLMVIIRANNFRYCVIITPLPAKFHNSGAEQRNEAEQSFIVIENHVLNWMENRNCSANICHIPIFAAHISPNVFVMPSFAKEFSIFKCGLLEMNRRRTEELTFKSLDITMESSLKHLAYSLNSLLDTFQVKGDFFSLGPLSYLLASELENLAQQQKRKSVAHTGKSSVVIVDRILDLAGPLSQSYETMLDKISLALPHIPGHTFDVCVNMEDLASCKNAVLFGRPLLAPGCISHKNNTFEESSLNAILFKNPREVLIEVNRNLVECAGKEGINVEGSRLTPDVLRKKITSFKEKPKSMFKFSGLLQQALAVVQALEYSSSNSVDNLAAIEKALLQYLTTSSEEVLSSIMQMINDKNEMNYKMEEIIIFLAFFYMLSGETNLANESAMQATLMEAFFQDEDMNELLSLFVNERDVNDESVLNAVRTLFAIFKRLGTLRRRLKRYSALFKSPNPAFPASYNPLLKQLLSDIFDPALLDIPDIEFHSVGLKDYIKTGFSLFMNVAKPKPRDNPIIFLIILGGVTPSEMKIIHEIAAKHKEIEIILGCTEVLSPANVLKDIGRIVQNLSSETYENSDM